MLAPEPTLARYSMMVKSLPQLDRDEELRLARRWRDAGDRAARDFLAETMLRTVLVIARKYRRYGVDVSELVAEGNVGLVQALSKFEPERGIRLATYASHWIRAYMLEYVLRSWSLVGGGSGALRTKLFFKLRRERARVVTLVGEGEEADRLLAQRLDTTPEKLRELVTRIEQRDLSLDATTHAESSTPRIDSLPSSDLDQEELAMTREARDRARAVVRSALDVLDARERFVVESHWMADDDDELSLAQIGRKLGISRERARQLEARARRKLRERVHELERADSGARAA